MMEEKSSGSPSRWSRLKSQRANLALFTIGLVLIVLSPIWRFTIAPAVRIVATDQDRISFYSGTLADYVRAPGQPPVGAQPAKRAITVQMRYSNPLGRSTSTIALLQGDNALIDAVTRVHLSDVRHFYAIDRQTALQVPDHGSDVNRAGTYYFIFPFNTPRTDLPVWDNLSETTRKSTYVQQETLSSIKTYLLSMRYAGQPVPAPPDFPSQVTGAQLKAIAPPSVPAIGDTDTVRIAYKGNLTLDFVVEPISGTQIGIRRQQQSVYMSVEDPARGLSFTQVIYTLDFAQQAASFQEGVNFAKDEIAKIKLQFLYLPAGYLVIGIACVLIGLFTTSKE